MASTKISALTTDTAPDRALDFGVTYDASAAGNKKIALQEFGGYTLAAFLGVSLAPADSTTYYFSPLASAGLATVAANHKLRILRTGTIRKIYIDGTCTVGSAETSTISLRLNDTTDTTITSAAVFNATPLSFSNTALSIAVTAGDWISVKWVTPVFVTNPTVLSMWAHIWIA